MRNFLIYYRDRKGVVRRQPIMKPTFLEAADFANRLMFKTEVIILIRDTSFDDQNLNIKSGQ